MPPTYAPPRVEPITPRPATVSGAATTPVPPAVNAVLVRLAMLDQIAPTADDIARYLTDRGYRGRPLDAGSCPIANYLTAGRDDVRAAVGDHTVSVWTTDRAHLVEVAASPAVVAFVHRFDGGQYPHLEATP